MAEFGERLKALREKKGITQQTLADQLYVTRRAVSRWECGAPSAPGNPCNYGRSGGSRVRKPGSGAPGRIFHKYFVCRSDLLLLFGSLRKAWTGVSSCIPGMDIGKKTQQSISFFL